MGSTRPDTVLKESRILSRRHGDHGVAFCSLHFVRHSAMTYLTGAFVGVSTIDVDNVFDGFRDNYSDSVSEHKDAKELYRIVFVAFASLRLCVKNFLFKVVTIITASPGP